MDFTACSALPSFCCQLISDFTSLKLFPVTTDVIISLHRMSSGSLKATPLSALLWGGQAAGNINVQFRLVGWHSVLTLCAHLANCHILRDLKNAHICCLSASMAWVREPMPSTHTQEAKINIKLVCSGLMVQCLRCCWLVLGPGPTSDQLPSNASMRSSWVRPQVLVALSLQGLPRLSSEMVPQPGE